MWIEDVMSSCSSVIIFSFVKKRNTYIFSLFIDSLLLISYHVTVGNVEAPEYVVVPDVVFCFTTTVCKRIQPTNYHLQNS